MSDQDIDIPIQFEHSFTNLLGHAPTTEAGIALRQWVKHQGLDNFIDLLSWDEDELKAHPTYQTYSLDAKGQGLNLKTNHLKQYVGS